MSGRFVSCLIAAVVSLGPASLAAQENKSATLAKELVAALDAAKLDSIAAKDPESTDGFFAALYIPKLQFVVISGNYNPSILIDTRIYRREYRDAYLDLQGASAPATRVVIEDRGADGLSAKRDESGMFDNVQNAASRTKFDGDWKKQKISEDVYLKTFSSAEVRYTQILEALLKEAKRPR